MSSENEAIARAAYDALNRRDLDAFVALIDPEVTFKSLIAEAEGSTYHGHEGVRQWWHEVVGGLGGVRFRMNRFHDFGDRGYADLVVSAEVSEVEVPQRMFQAVKLRDGKPYWWQSCRTEEEARRILGVGA